MVVVDVEFCVAKKVMAETGEQMFTGMYFCPLIIGYFCKFMREVSLDNCNTFGLGVSTPDICPQCSDRR